MYFGGIHNANYLNMFLNHSVTLCINSVFNQTFWLKMSHNDIIKSYESYLTIKIILTQNVLYYICDPGIGWSPVDAAGLSAVQRVCWSLCTRWSTYPCWCYLQGHNDTWRWSGTWTYDCCEGCVQGIFMSFLSQAWIKYVLGDFFCLWWKVFVWMEDVLLTVGVKSRQEMSL